jgi:putative intracellular protease/amidase
VTNKSAYLYAFEGMSDWEYGYLAAELNSGRYFARRGNRLELLTVARGSEPVRTMGGLRVLPDLSLEDFDESRCALLILPGGYSWLEPGHESILEKTRSLLESGTPVAAICGATIALARAGLLDEREHTSNDLAFLKSVCPEYRSEALYRHEPAEAGKGLVTAAGIAPLEFAHRALELLGVFSTATLEAWLALNEKRSEDDYARLMETLKDAGPAKGGEQ